MNAKNVPVVRFDPNKNTKVYVWGHQKDAKLPNPDIKELNIQPLRDKLKNV
jgi:hypothetical protein